MLYYEPEFNANIRKCNTNIYTYDIDDKKSAEEGVESTGL